MKHVTKTISALLLTLIIGLQSLAFEVDGINYTFTDDDEGTAVAVVAKESGKYRGAIVIPSTISYENETYRVIGIQDYAFYECASLTSVEIPNTVASFGQEAFRGCSKLTTINIPSGITEIRYACFYQCSSLTSIEIPNTVKSFGQEAFSYCSKLTTINIPSEITEIPAYCFQECLSLLSIEIPNTVTSFGDGAFSWCSKLTSINIPSGITEIPNLCFMGCLSLTSIEIPNTVTSFGNGAFGSCSKLTTINIPDGVIEIPNSCFYGCSSLTSVEIPNTVTFLGDCAFAGCSELTSINIPNGITEIPYYCFEECTSLTSIEIPNTVTSFGEYAFSRCSKLTTINIPDGITEIPAYCFHFCSSLTSIEIPNTVTSFGEYAFWGCSKLTTINIQNGITEIPAYCFAGTSLTSIEIPNTVTSFGEGAFHDCSKLTTINIPNGITEIPYRCLNCSSLTSIYCSAQEPPKISGGEYPRSATVYVPCGCKAAYMAAEKWMYFYNITETTYIIKLLSSDDRQGTVSYEGSPCEDEGKVKLVATPSSSSQFVRWNDGNTENPRTVIIDKDTIFTAVFCRKPSIYVTSRTLPICEAYNGDISISVMSGVEPYVYQWSDGSTEENRSGLQSGTYTVKVTDALGCFSEVGVMLAKNESNMPKISAKVEHAICGHDVGSITLSLSDGVEPYIYAWDNGETDMERNNLAPGKYSFSVTDKYGCKTVWSTTIRAESIKYNPEIALVSVSQEIKEPIL